MTTFVGNGILFRLAFGLAVLFGGLLQLDGAAAQTSPQTTAGQWGDPQRAVVVALAPGENPQFITAMRAFATSHALSINVARYPDAANNPDFLTLEGEDYRLTAATSTGNRDFFYISIAPRSSRSLDRPVVEAVVADLRNVAAGIAGASLMEGTLARFPRSPVRQFVVTGTDGVETTIFAQLRAVGVSFGFRATQSPPVRREMALYRDDGHLVVAPGNAPGELSLQFWPSDEGIANPDNQDQFLSTVAEALERIRGVNVIETDDIASDAVLQGYIIELGPGTRDLFLDRLRQFAVGSGFRFDAFDVGAGHLFIRFDRLDVHFEGDDVYSGSLDDFRFISIPTLHHPIAAAAAEALLSELVATVKAIPGAGIAECDTYDRSIRVADRNGPGGAALPANTSTPLRPMCH